jgi:uncharacterized membrane protein YidH (DUF202 family)
VFLAVVSTAISLVAVGVLPDSMRIRWSLGTHYGPEFAPTGLVLTAVPVAIVLVFGGARALAGAFEGREQGYKTRHVYELCTLAVLLSLVLIQVTLVVANLV